MKNLVPLALALFASAAACAADASGEQRLPYTCDNGNRIEIGFAADAEGRPFARLHFADEALTLPQVPSASGTLYRSGDIRLSTKDDEALFEDGKGNLRHCRQGDQAPAGYAPPVASNNFIDLHGNVRTLARIALPPNALLTLLIQDISRPRPLTLVEQQYELNGAQVPIPFTATIDRDLVGKRARIAVSARIEVGGKVRFASAKPVPAMQDGQPVAVELILQPVGRAPR